MNPSVETLWRELQVILRERGELTFEHDRMTPAEIAAEIGRTNGDPRVRRFVWEYYYPQRYGNEPGTLTDAEAAALLDSLRRQPEPVDAPAPAPTHGPTCGVCHRNPISTAPKP